MIPIWVCEIIHRILTLTNKDVHNYTMNLFYKHNKKSNNDQWHFIRNSLMNYSNCFNSLENKDFRTQQIFHHSNFRIQQQKREQFEYSDNYFCSKFLFFDYFFHLTLHNYNDNFLMYEV